MTLVATPGKAAMAIIDYYHVNRVVQGYSAHDEHIYSYSYDFSTPRYYGERLIDFYDGSSSGSVLLYESRMATGAYTNPTPPLQTGLHGYVNSSVTFYRLTVHIIDANGLVATGTTMNASAM